MTAAPLTPPPIARPKLNRHWPMRFGVIGFSFLLYIVACATPAVYWSTQGKIDAMPGLGGLAGGWCAMLYGNFGWCANFLLAAAALTLIIGLWRTAMILSILGDLLALQTFMLIGVELPADEGNVQKMHAVALGIGFYFWLASMLMIALGAFWLKVVSKPRPKAL